MAGTNALRLSTVTAFLVLSMGSASLAVAQTQLKFPPIPGEGNIPQNAPYGAPGPFWNSANMPPAPVRQMPPRQPAQQGKQTDNFDFQPRNRGFDEAENQSSQRPQQQQFRQRQNPRPQQQPQREQHKPEQRQAGNFNFQPRNRNNGNRGDYRGQRPPMPPQYGYRPHPPQPQFQRGARWGNGPGNFGPFRNMPFSNGPFNGDSPFGGGPFSWFGDGPKEGMANAWEDMINAPSRMGDMPGGWSFPEIGMPNPVDVGDQFGVAGEEFATEMPEFARELPDMFNFRP